MQCKTRLYLVPHLITFLIIIAATLVPLPSYAQRIEGSVIDVKSKEPLAFANIVLVGIDVYAERKIVEVTSSDVRASVSEEQLRKVPVDRALDAIALKTGIVRMGDELRA